MQMGNAQSLLKSKLKKLSMENNYEAESGYQIYSIEDAHVQAPRRLYGLVTAAHQLFQTADEAEQWIQTDGERHVQLPYWR
jgi:hypothetical protein